MGVNKLTTLQSTIGMNCFKFDILDEKLQSVRIVQDKVTVYIDLYALICKCYSESFVNKLDRADSAVVLTDLVVTLLNALGHYKFYVVKRLKKKCAIVLIHNTKLTKYQKDLDVDYRWDRIDRLSLEHSIFGSFNEKVMEAVLMIQRICMYIEDVYVITPDSELDFPGCVLTLQAQNRFSTTFGIMLTRNLAAAQLIGSRKMIMIYPKSRVPHVLTEKNFLSDGFLRGSKRESSISHLDEIPVRFIPYLCTIGGCEHILPAKGTGTFPHACKIAAEMLHSGQLTKNVSFQTFLEELESYMIRKKKKGKDAEFYYSKSEYNHLIDRYRAVSVPLNVAAASKGQLMAIHACIVDLYNQQYLDDLTDSLARLNDPDRLVNFDHLNAQRVDPTDEYNGEWW